MATTEGLRAERLARVNDAIQGSGYNQTEIARAMDDRGKLPDQR